MKKIVFLMIGCILSVSIQAQTVSANSNSVYLKVGKWKTGNSEIDRNIPENPVKKSNVYALIIGNEDYSTYQTGLATEVNVDFAENDARIFAEYLIKTLGVEEKNVDVRINATLGQMKQGLAKLKKLAEVSNGNAELIFYYSGHGLPDEQTKEGYIMPVDISGTDIKSAIKVNDLYAQLTEFPVKRATVFLDACFSGGGRNQGLVSLKGVKVKPQENILKGPLVVFASSTGDESSAYLKDKQHGIFTYFLVKKIQETKGNLSYKNLFDYVYENVRLESVRVNNKNQTPQINGSNEVREVWEDWNLR